MTMREINLKKYKNNDAKIFTNRDIGILAREKYKLDESDKMSDEVINVILPSDTWGINPSFFGGLFENSLKRLGREGFYKKYRFVFSNDESITESLLRDIDDNIDHILRVIDDEEN